MRELRSLLLHEYGVVEGVELDLEQERLLRGCSARLTLHARGGRMFAVEAADVVGTFLAARLRVVIRPKVPIARLLYLISLSRRLPVLTNVAPLDEKRDLLAVMQRLFAHSLAEAMRGGLVRSYVHAEGALPAPRGRIDAMAIVRRRFGIIPPVDCGYQDFSADIEPNQRLFAAGRLLARVEDGRTEAARALRSLAGRFDEVSVRDFRPEQVTAQTLDRRWERFATAIALADVVLRHGSVELDAGRTAAVGFLVEMDRLYEDVLVEGLRDALGELPERWVRHLRGAYLDVENKMRLEPDIVWYGEDHHPRIVIDAKYKVTDAVRREDLYQVVTYCHALRVSKAALIYAGTIDHRVQTRHGPDVRVFCFDPDGEPDIIRTRLADLAKRLRAFAQAPVTG